VPDIAKLQVTKLTVAQVDASIQATIARYSLLDNQAQ